ncbi:MAG: ABC transporter permease [Crocinitomicaceae bacterium]|nr:ABC transporter permease [Crocinitomicaceae bacterium]
MNIARFIAGRILKSEDKNQVSRPIVRIATAGIATGVVMMILALAGLRGFQREIRNKVIGFGSHFQIIGSSDDLSRESGKLEFDTIIYNNLKRVNGVKHVQVFATKPGILETKEAIQGVVIKGAATDFNWDFLAHNLVEGILPKSDSTNWIIVSSMIANRLKIKPGDKISLYFVNHETDVRQQNFFVRGIYDTGLEDFDDKYVFTDISYVQRYAGWGVQAQMLVDTACSDLGEITVGGLGFGGENELTYNWNNPRWKGEGPFFIRPVRDTTLRLIVSDKGGAIADTALTTIDFADDNSAEPCRKYTLQTVTSGGSYKNYIGGYEVLISDYEQLTTATDDLHKAIPFFLQIVNITDRNPEIFSWLKMLDINVVIIIILMIGISIVNMTSALLIIILERQNMIGTLKAFGIGNRPVLVIFLINAAYIIGRGLLIGNIIGLSLAFIQQKWKIIQLDPANYYVDTMPVYIDFGELALLNTFTLAVCVLVLILPALYVTTITPVKAIRFD